MNPVFPQINPLEKPSLLYLGLGRMLMIGSHWDSNMHHQAAIKIILSKDHPFMIRLENQNWMRTHGVIINARVVHQMKDFEGPVFSCSIVPDRKRGAQLQKHVLRGEQIQIPELCKISGSLGQFSECLESYVDSARAFQICESMIDALTGIRDGIFRLDDRILAVMDWIQMNLSEPISARQLARTTFLSEDRFMHLFKEQLGLPLRK